MVPPPRAALSVDDDQERPRTHIGSTSNPSITPRGSDGPASPSTRFRLFQPACTVQEEDRAGANLSFPLARTVSTMYRAAPMRHATALPCCLSAFDAAGYTYRVAGLAPVAQGSFLQRSRAKHHCWLRSSRAVHWPGSRTRPVWFRLAGSAHGLVGV